MKQINYHTALRLVRYHNNSGTRQYIKAKDRGSKKYQLPGGEILEIFSNQYSKSWFDWRKYISIDKDRKHALPYLKKIVSKITGVRVI